MTTIRGQIGTPPNSSNANWKESIIINSFNKDQFYQNKVKNMNNHKNISVEKIFELLTKNYQLILSGPPGTSKSYLADAVSKMVITEDEKNSILKIQFHPQYSYQDFVGGFIVNGDKVETNRGVFLRFLDNVKKHQNRNFVLIIDEINRANVSSVFGELIQCLDRNYIISALIAGKEEQLFIPKNLFIIATMNTSDRTLGALDFALRRRFVDIYIGSNENELIDKTKTECGVSLADFLTRINNNLRNTLRNNELVIGQTIFYNEYVSQQNLFYWNNESLEDLFNYKILPIVEDYCNKETGKIMEVVGDKLSKRLTNKDFIDAVINFVA